MPPKKFLTPNLYISIAYFIAKDLVPRTELGKGSGKSFKEMCGDQIVWILI